MDLSTVKTPSERIVRHDCLSTVFNMDKMLKDGKFIVQLACNHYVYTRAQNKTVCPRCTEMLRRSLKDGSEDYDSFRKGLRRDDMIWKDDPVRQFNERTDLSGNFLSD